MILSSVIYETLLDSVRKDKRGRSISVEEYNSLAPIVNESVFSHYYKEFESSPESSSKMGDFRVIGESVAIAGGVGTLPVSFYSLSGKPYYTDASGVIRWLDLVSDMEHAWRQGDYLTQGSLAYPTFRLGTATVGGAKQIYVTPTAGINPIVVDYIRVANTPKLDYFISDSTLLYVWGTAGENMNVPAGSTSMSGVAGAAVVASQTVNWEFDNDDLPLIISLFMQIMGIQMPDEALWQGGTTLREKEEQP